MKRSLGLEMAQGLIQKRLAEEKNYACFIDSEKAFDNEPPDFKFLKSFSTVFAGMNISILI